MMMGPMPPEMLKKMAEEQLNKILEKEKPQTEVMKCEHCGWTIGE